MKDENDDDDLMMICFESLNYDESISILIKNQKCNVCVCVHYVLVALWVNVCV